MFRIPFTLKNNRAKDIPGERMMRVWEMLGLEESLMGMKTMDLSGGQRQRILLSMAVLLDKPLLLLDEPTSALDADSVERVTGLLRCLTHEGKSVLTVSHHQQLVVACDKRIKL
jgi:ABC-type lipoprotein export system ATPase subunit